MAYYENYTILRVEAISLQASVIIEHLKHSGVDCVELED
jgi:hypothetical protein